MMSGFGNPENVQVNVIMSVEFLVEFSMPDTNKGDAVRKTIIGYELLQSGHAHLPTTLTSAILLTTGEYSELSA